MPSAWVEPSSNVEIVRQVIVEFRHTNTMGEIQTSSWCCSICSEKLSADSSCVGNVDQIDLT
jgi:hypothetical protein